MVVGTTCPVIHGLTFIKGQPLTIGQTDGNLKQVVALECWATWCPPCRDSIPHLTHLQKQYEDKHVYIVGVTQEDDVKKVERFVVSQGAQMDYTVAIDAGGEVGDLMAKAGARGIPHAFVIGPDNKILFSGHPCDPAFEEQLRRAAQSASDRRQKEALPLIMESYDELMARSVKELKTMLTDRGISLAGLAEKGDLARKIVEACATVTYYK